MCDTLIALPAATARGRTLFAKNSDRERNEAQFLELAPAACHPAGTTVRATYITLPQARVTHACLLSRPYWMWGAEMGVNELGVAIGNEAVHAIVPAPRRRALIGMDLVRLGLERGRSAAEALEVIVALLERHGQGGNCGHLGRFYYHNSFLVADAREAYVLETVDRWWAVERVEDMRALSNALSIGADPSRVSPALKAHAQSVCWCDQDGAFDFAGRLIDETRDAISFGRGRCARASELLAARRGDLTAQAMMEILRDHGAHADAGWAPAKQHDRTLCMHAGPGARRSQTTASLVAELQGRATVSWVTASATPCLSLFKPIVLEAGGPDRGPRPDGHYDGESRWWRHERLHRAALADYPAAIAMVAPERARLEAGFHARMDWATRAGGPAVRAAVRECWREADAAERRWWTKMLLLKPSGGQGAFARSWARLNHVAGLPRVRAPDSRRPPGVAGPHGATRSRTGE